MDKDLGYVNAYLVDPNTDIVLEVHIKPTDLEHNNSANCSCNPYLVNELEKDRIYPDGGKRKIFMHRRKHELRSLEC